MYILSILALIFAALNALAVWKNIHQLETIAKPAVMICLFAWLTGTAGLDGAPMWFGLGLLLSLAGDLILLWWPETRFLLGLSAFLLTHLSYLVGFNILPQPISLWSLILAAIVALGAARVLRRILLALRAKRQERLVWPVTIYGGVITLMLLSALLTLSNPEWGATASLLVGLGAFLFYLSDILLAWNKFVVPIKNGRFLNIILYHLGQIALIAGVVLQYGG